MTLTPFGWARVAGCVLAALALCAGAGCGRRPGVAATDAPGGPGGPPGARAVPAPAGQPELTPARVEPPAGGLTAEDFDRHVAALQAGLPAGFTIVVEPPFVVIGDEPPARVRLRAERTVRWAAQKLKQDFFEKGPAEIIDVWLLRDAVSYRKHCREMFGRAPTTPFGFCTADGRTIVMNVATGGGTLVHEIVHPFVRADFAACPAWLNEGLASLYEQSAERDGHIVGLTNWRLKGLQESIRAGRVPSFWKLTHMSSSAFYGRSSAVHYAQARYLCYYLQDRGLLVEFYRRFRAAQAADPSGYSTLQEVLGEEDMGAFRRRWEAFVLRLTFP